MWQIVLLQQAVGLDAVCNLGPDGVVGADGFVGGVPEAEGLFRHRQVEAAGEVADRVAGGVAQVVAAHRLHNHFDRIRGVLGDQVGERMPAAVAAPALAGFMAGFSRAFLDHGFGVAAGTAGDSRVDGREDNHSEGVKGRCFSRTLCQMDGQGVARAEEQKKRKRRVGNTAGETGTRCLAGSGTIENRHSVHAQNRQPGHNRENDSRHTLRSRTMLYHVHKRENRYNANNDVRNDKTIHRITFLIQQYRSRFRRCSYRKFCATVGALWTP
jgi:hypothetical protein